MLPTGDASKDYVGSRQVPSFFAETHASSSQFLSTIKTSFLIAQMATQALLESFQGWGICGLCT